MMGAMGVWMLLWGAVGISLLMLMVVVIVRLARPGVGSQQVTGPTAEEVLYRRYAAGELSGDDYLELATKLRRDSM